MLNPKEAGYLFINIKISWITKGKRGSQEFYLKGEKLNRFSSKEKKKKKVETRENKRRPVRI